MRQLMILLAATLLALTPPAAVRAIDPDEMFADPAMEERAREVGKQLRCLVCQNQSIFDSNAGLAHDLRMVVRERIEAGDDDAAILSFVSDRFGDYVLLNPPVKQTTYLLWAAPVALLLAAFLLGAGYLHRRRPVADAPLSEAEQAAARRLLEGGEP
jgi:cytochrome c-type biogenesis protein CcmH